MNPAAIDRNRTWVVAELHRLAALWNGFDVRSTVAMLGTLVSLVVIGVLGWVFTRVGHFTGQVDEGSQYISGIAAQVDLRGLLLAGLVIGALGVLDDVTVTQTWAVWELADVDPDATPGYTGGKKHGHVDLQAGADELDELHHRHRVHEMQAHEPLGPVGVAGEPGDRDRGGVRGGQG